MHQQGRSVMWLLAQGETVLIQKALEELNKQQGSNTSSAYVFALVVIIFGCGAFYVLRYMLGHTRDIHDKSNALIMHMSETFKTECREQREQHFIDHFAARDMVHAIRDVSQTAVTGKEFISELQMREVQIKEERDAALKAKAERDAIRRPQEK